MSNLVTKTLSVLALIFTSGCTTVTFAPPDIAITDGAKNLSTAQTLVELFITEYRDTANGANDDRSYYDLPLLAGAIGAVTATALGAGPNVAIASGGAGALLTGGKTYFNPDAKAAVFDDAIDALVCIQQISYGLEPYTPGGAGAKSLTTANQSVPDEADYYFAIKNAVLLVETHVRKRLRATRSDPDIAALTAQIENLTADEERMEEEAQIEAEEAATKSPTTLNVAILKTQLLTVKVMSVKLDKCILRAKS